MRLFLYDRKTDSVTPISRRAATSRARHSDAGIHDEFVVYDLDAETALLSARRWIANRADEDEPNVPDDLGLYEACEFVALQHFS